MIDPLLKFCLSTISSTGYRYSVTVGVVRIVAVPQLRRRGDLRVGWVAYTYPNFSTSIASSSPVNSTAAVVRIAYG